MADKMDLIVAGPDRHVLAAAVRTNRGGSAPAVADLVGAGLQLRDPVTGDLRVTIPAEELQLAETDLRDDVLLCARQFALVDNLPEEGKKPHNTPLGLSGANITVTLPGQAPGGAIVWVLIEGGPQPISYRLTVAANGSGASEALQLPSGNYRALVLATGVQAAVVTVTIP